MQFGLLGTVGIPVVLFHQTLGEIVRRSVHEHFALLELTSAIGATRRDNEHEKCDAHGLSMEHGTKVRHYLKPYGIGRLVQIGMIY